MIVNMKEVGIMSQTWDLKRPIALNTTLSFKWLVNLLLFCLFAMDGQSSHEGAHIHCFDVRRLPIPGGFLNIFFDFLLTEMRRPPFLGGLLLQMRANIA